MAVTTQLQIEQKVQALLGNEELTFTEEELQKGYNSFYNRVTKRVIDVVLACIAVLLLSPCYILVGLCVVIESGFPIFYRADRGGYKGKTFKINKFRSMVKEADKIGGGTTALNDSRITRVGAFLRKTKLDETAQLFNIINGSMSFVGPRPELLQYTNAYDDTEMNILNVRPGITDFSSLTFINLDEIVGDLDADEMYEKYVLKKKNALRLKYVKEVSFKTDVKLFFATVFRVLNKISKILKILKK